VRLEVGPQPGAVLTLEGPQLLDLALQAGALLLEGAHGLDVPALGVLVESGGLGARLALHGLRAGAGVADHRVGAVLGLGDHLLALRAGVAHQAVAVGLGAGQHLLGLRLGLVDVPVGRLGGQREHPGSPGAVVLAGLLDRRRGCGDLRRGGRLGALVGPRGATTAGTELVVLLDQAGQLGLHHVEERVDLVLVVAPLADGRLLEDDVVHVGRREWHRGHLRSDGGNRDVVGRAAADHARAAPLFPGDSAVTRLRRADS
jgi:hypothetical protein